MSERYLVTVRGREPKLVKCARVEPVEEFVEFFDDAGRMVFFVRREELVSVEPYVEPPY